SESLGVSVTALRSLVESITKEKVAWPDLPPQEAADALFSGLGKTWRTLESKLDAYFLMQAPDKYPNPATDGAPPIAEPSVPQLPPDENQHSDERESSFSPSFVMAFFTGGLLHSLSAAAPGRRRRNPLTVTDDGKASVQSNEPKA